MESANTIVQIVTTVGFPIAMCLLIFWYMMKESEAHKEETNSLKDVINELKLAIQKLTDKMEK